MTDKTMKGNSEHRLARLDELDGYRVADGEPDPRGWEVRSSDGRTVGKVDSMIADTGTMKVRYLDIELDKDTMKLSEERHVLVPIGGATLHENDDVVGLPMLSSSQIAKLAPWNHGSISREDEHRMMTQFDSRYTPAPYADFYSHQNFNDKGFFGARREGRGEASYLTRSEEELAVGTRRERAGELNVKKRVETEHVKEAVPVTREEATIERRPATGSTGTKPTIGEDEIRVPLMAEEVVAEKRVVPKEEIVIRKHAKQETKTVEADLKKERIDLDTKGDARLDKRP